MTEQANGFTDTGDNAAVVYAANLLRHYSFELGGYSAEELLAHWGATYSADWMRLAIIEALYQGRYKAVSVEQLLMFWQRRGQPLYHFNHEFERLVCNRLPRNLVPAASSIPKPPVSQTRSLEERSDQFLSTLKLLSERRHPFADRPRDFSSGLQLPAFAETTPDPAPESKPEPGANDTAKAQLSQLQAWLNLEETVPPEPAKGSSRVLAAIEQAHQQLAQEQVDQAKIDQTQIDQTQIDQTQIDQTQAGQKPDSARPQPADTAVTASPTDAASLLAEAIVALQAGIEALLTTWSTEAATLNSRLLLELIRLYAPNGSCLGGDKAPIRQFTPAAETDEFYSKLKLVALPLSESETAPANAAGERQAERSVE